jgi:hypothetical protein
LRKEERDPLPYSSRAHQEPVSQSCLNGTRGRELIEGTRSHELDCSQQRMRRSSSYTTSVGAACAGHPQRVNPIHAAQPARRTKSVIIPR